MRCGITDRNQYQIASNVKTLSNYRVQVAQPNYLAVLQGEEHEQIEQHVQNTIETLQSEPQPKRKYVRKRDESTIPRASPTIIDDRITSFKDKPIKVESLLQVESGDFLENKQSSVTDLSETQQYAFCTQITQKKAIEEDISR